MSAHTIRDRSPVDQGERIAVGPRNGIATSCAACTSLSAERIPTWGSVWPPPSWWLHGPPGAYLGAGEVAGCADLRPGTRRELVDGAEGDGARDQRADVGGARAASPDPAAFADGAFRGAFDG